MLYLEVVDVLFSLRDVHLAIGLLFTAGRILQSTSTLSNNTKKIK